ncbi:MAG: fasciclin domain-containing protein [Bacteroidota bacterium]
MKLFKFNFLFCTLLGGLLLFSFQSCEQENLSKSAYQSAQLSKLIEDLKATKDLAVTEIAADLVQVETRSPEISYTELIGFKPELSILGAAIARLPELETTLSDKDLQITLFTPTNDAFEAFLSSAGFASIDEVPLDALVAVLSDHVVAGRLAIPLLDLTEMTLAENIITVASSSNDQASINGEIEVTKANGFIGAGMVHYVDGVITTSSTIEEGTTVTVRNTYNDFEVAEVSFAAFLGLPEDGLDLTSTSSNTMLEFPDVLAIDLSGFGGPVITGLYDIDITESSIEYTLLPTLGNPFWEPNFRTLEAGVRDRYYLTFSAPHNISDFTVSDPAINLRIDSDTVAVVEVREGFEFRPGASFVITLK